MNNLNFTVDSNSNFYNILIDNYNNYLNSNVIKSTPLFEVFNQYYLDTIVERVSKYKDDAHNILNLEYRKYKDSLHTVCYPATFEGKKKLCNLKSVTNLVFLDIDGLKSKDEAIELRNEYFQKYNWICFSPLSASELGFHMIINTSGIYNNCNSVEEMEFNYNNTVQYLSYHFFNGLLDMNSRSLTRHSCISQDKTILKNDNPEILKINIEIVNNWCINNPLPTKSNTKSNKKNVEKVVKIKEVKETKKAANITRLTTDLNTKWNDMVKDNEGNEYLLSSLFTPDPVRSKGLIYKQIINEDLFDDTDKSIFFPNAIPFIRVDEIIFENWLIEEGNRNNILGTICMMMLFLNSNLENKTEILNYISKINKKYCETPLSDSEINKIFNYNLNNQIENRDLFNDNVLIYNKNYIRTIWSKFCTLTNDDKNSISHSNYWNETKTTNFNLINDAMEDLFSNNQKIKQTTLKELTGLSKESIDRYLNDYFPELKEKMISYNLNLNSELNKKDKKSVRTIYIKKEKTIEGSDTFLNNSNNEPITSIEEEDKNTLLLILTAIGKFNDFSPRSIYEVSKKTELNYEYINNNWNIFKNCASKYRVDLPA